MEPLRAESLPYCVTSADLADSDWPSAVLAEMTRTHSRGLYLLVRSDGVPVRQVVLSRDDEVSEADIVAAVGPDTGDGSHGARAEIRGPATALSLTIVICTRDRPDGLRVCLEAMERQTDADFEVLVVDNSEHGSDDVRQAVDAAGERLRIRLIHQPVSGLSNARNAALSSLSTDLVAWIDDDEEADSSWVLNLRQVFAADPSVSCVVGDMLPARLATSTDLMFEQFGGYNKRPDRVRQQFRKSRLGSRIFYPLPSFGAGGNMAMRTAILRGLPPFDADLGAGAGCPAGEDTLMFSEILDAGYAIAYEPRVVTWHHHRASVAELREQLDGYGRGLGGYYVALVLRRPSRLVKLAVLFPRAVFDQFSPNSMRNSGSSEELLQVRHGNRWAILQGAAGYLRVRLSQRLRSR